MLSLFVTVFCFINPVSAFESIPEVICSPKNCYTILEKLGEGAFGKVYSAKDSSGTLYAIKCYKNRSFSGFDFFSDPKREFERGQQLDHPNIIKSYDYFSDVVDGEPVDYLVLQYVEGATLSQHPKRSLRQKEILKAFEKLLSALTYALTQDLVHLDLHGGNLMLDRNYELMVIDLASFFTFEEINDFFVAKSSKSSTEVQERQLFKEAKLEQFFAENPRLFAKMQQVYQGNVARSSGKSEMRNHILLIYLVEYFNRITDSCVDLILKSDLDRGERIALRTKLKNYAWNYEEDADEGIDQPISYYLEQLSKLSASLF